VPAHYVEDGTLGTQSLVYYNHDQMGNVTHYEVDAYNPTWNAGEAGYSSPYLTEPLSYWNQYNLYYGKFDSYRESVVNGWSSYFQPGSTTTAYDGNTNIVSVTDQFAGNNYRSFVNDQAGRIRQKTQNGATSTFYFENDKPFASVTPSAADFDFNQQAISEQFPAATPGGYVVANGDTLRRIAASAYGDGRLWYLIADANGLSGDADLVVGKQLKIPSNVTNIHNTSDTFRPYKPGDIIGDTTPTLPDPPPPPQQSSGGGDDCGGFGQILVMIVTIVVAIALPVALGMTTAVGAGIGAAVGSLAGQIVANVIGIQDGIDFGAIAVAGLTAGLTAGVTGAAGLNLTGSGMGTAIAT